MEKSLDELTELLLNRITVCGSTGISLDQLSEIVRSFNQDHQAKNRILEKSPRAHDEEVLFRVWQRLGQHPNISIGENHTYNSIPLAELLARINHEDLPRLYTTGSIATNSPGLDNKPHQSPTRYDDLMLNASGNELDDVVATSTSTEDHAIGDTRSLQPQNGDDTDYEPRPSSLRRAKRPRVRRSRAYTSDSDEEGKPLGRPRRFARGTEKFWQRQFWQARLNANPDTNLPVSRAGTMSDPAGLELFESRPPNFDDTLVEAKAAGLPLPEGPEDISSSWVRQIKAVIDRRDSGTYLTPRGLHQGKAQNLSQILIVKCDRLQTLDFSNNKEAPRFRFLTSSMAHSQPHPAGRSAELYKRKTTENEGQRFDASLAEKTPKHLFITSCIAHSMLYLAIEKHLQGSHKSATPVSDYNRQIYSSTAEPRWGIFRERTNSKPAIQTPTRITSDQPLLTPSQYRELMDSTDSDTDLQLIPRNSRSQTRSRQRSSTSTVTSIDISSNSRSKIVKLKLRQDTSIPDTDLGSRPARTRKATQKATETFGNEDISSPSLFEASHTQPHRPQASNRKRSAPTIVPEPDDDIQKRPAKRHKASSRTVYELGQLIRKIILDLVEQAGGAAPGSTTIIRDAIASRWYAAGETKLPDLEKLRNIINNLWTVKKIQKSYFVYHAGDGTKQQQAIIALPHIDPGGETFQKLKNNIQKAGKADYMPPEWKDGASALPYSISAQREALDAERLAGLDTHHSSQQLLSTTLQPEAATNAQVISPSKRIRRSSSMVSSIEDVDDNNTSSRPQRNRRPPKRLRELTETPEAEPDLTGPSPKRRKRASIAKESPQFTREVSSDSTSDTGLVGTDHGCFLTLKVPGLGGLPQVQAFNTDLKTPLWNGFKPIAVRSVAAEDSESESPPPSASTRKRRERVHVSRRAKDRRFHPRTLRPVWDKVDGYLLATCLQDILETQASYDLKLRARPHGNPLERAFDKVDIVWAWEERVDDEISDIDHSGLFVNHLATVNPDVTVPISSWKVVNFDADYLPSESELEVFDSWPPFVAALEEATAEAEQVSNEEPQQRSTGRPLSSTKSEKSLKRKAGVAALGGDDDGFDEDEEQPLFRNRPRRSTAGHRKARRFSPTLEDSDDDYQADTTAGDHAMQLKSKAKQNRELALLSQSDATRLLVTVTVIRTLAGGIDMVARWPLIRTFFPALSEAVLKQQWQNLSYDQPESVEVFTTNFQDAYIEALEQNEVPSVHYDDLESTDWLAIIDWAKRKLVNSTTLKQPSRLVSRADLLSSNELHFRHLPSIHSVATSKSGISTQRREEIASTHIFGTPFSPLPSPTSNPFDHDHLRARSLILSTLLTPASPSSSSSISTKLSSLLPTRSESENLIRSTLDSLQQDKLITTTRRNATSSSTSSTSALINTYTPTSHFYSSFTHTTISTPLLHSATAFKLDILDPAFANNQPVTIPRDTTLGDGEMICILNLLAGGMVRIKPGSDVPTKTRYGLDWARVGYDVGKTGREKVEFGVILAPRGSYVMGDVIGEKRSEKPIPDSHGEGVERMVPVWIDVNGKPQQGLWEMMLASVIGMVSLRPGVSSRSISAGLGGALAEWEVDAMLSWAEEVGFVQKTAGGKTWEAGIWWWLSAGRGDVKYEADELGKRKMMAEARPVEREVGAQDASLPEEGAQRRRKLTAKARESSQQIEMEEAPPPVEEEEYALPGAGVSEIAGRWVRGDEWQALLQMGKGVGEKPKKMRRAATGKRHRVEFVDDAAKALADDDDDDYNDEPAEPDEPDDADELNEADEEQL